MTNHVRDIILACTLVLVAGVWTWLVIDTIPPGFGDGEIGARAFPLVLGILLATLSVLLLLRLVLAKGWRAAGKTVPGDAGQSIVPPIRWIPAFLILLEIVLYGVLLEKIGFVLSTPLIILLVMIVNLRVRSIRKLFGMAFGLTIGCWLVFEKLFGIYMANGTWINLG
jgi:putative tricarboxylic transport membrane protein